MTRTECIRTRLFRAAVPATVSLAAVLVDTGSATAQEPSSFLQACPASDPSQVVVSLSGTVSDKESEALLPGSVVRLEYRNRSSLPAGTEPEVRTVADARGRYRFCGLIAFARTSVSAILDGREGKSVDFELNGDLTLDLTFELGEPAYLVFSVVAAETGAPITNATIELGPIPLAAMTDSLGRAALREVPPYEYDIRARHIGYAEQEQSLTVEEGQQAELRIELVTQAVTLEPLRVEITGRDPYLLEMGFYERMNLIEDGYFATQEEIEPYIMFRTLFQFKKELFVRYARNRFVMIDGWPMHRRGFQQHPGAERDPVHAGARDRELSVLRGTAGGVQPDSGCGSSHGRLQRIDDLDALKISGESKETPLDFRRELSRFDATMVVVGGIIGAGIFINPYIVAQRLDSGPWVLAAWAGWWRHRGSGRFHVRGTRVAVP